MTNLKTFLAVIAVSFLALPSLALAQTGRVVGEVTDSGTGDALPGANVVIQGTNIGAATNADGQYVISNAPVGSQTVVATYVGYESQERQVEVAAGEDTELDIEMGWAGVEGEEVTITEQAQGQNQAINEQLAANTIQSVVSSEKIRQLPDENAATAVSRLPGVSLQNGDQVVVRGVEAKYNTISVNGIQLPSTTTNRSTSLGFISSNMLSGIEVSKTITPAMDANSIGGNVNLRLQEAPDDFHFDVMLQGDYNEQDHTADNYRAWSSVSNRFFDDKVGVFVQGNARRFDGGGDIASATWTPLPEEDEVAGRRPYGLQRYDLQDQFNVVNEYGASVLLDYRLPGNGKILLQNAYSSERFDNASVTDRLNLTNSRGQRNFLADRTIGDRYLLVNSLQGEHGLGNLGIDWTLSHSRSSREDDLGYSTEFNGVGYFEGQTLPNWTSEEQVFDLELQEGTPGSVGNGQTEYDDYGERRLAGNLDLTLPIAFGFISGEVQGGGKYTQMSRERDFTSYRKRLSDGGDLNSGAADFLRSIGADPQSALNLGVFADPSYAQGRGQYYLEERWAFSGALNVDYLDQYFRNAQTGWESPALAQSNRDDYSSEERIAAGYLMGDFGIGDYINVLGGVRYENWSFDNSARFVNQTLYDGSGAVLDTLNAERSYGNFFPNIQLQVKPADWFDIRLAYTKSTSRPDYQRLLPNTWTDGNVGQAGNPDLEPTIADNFDAFFSVYNNRVGLFTVGLFAKRLSNVGRAITIRNNTLDRYEGTFWAPNDAGYPVCEDGNQRISCPEGPRVATMNPDGDLDTYVNNPDDGLITGFEVDWQTNFWYLPRPLNSLVFNINYTRMNSEIDWQSVYLVKEDPDCVFCNFVQRDTTRPGRLYQQGEDILNATLGADIRGFSGRVSFRYQGEVLGSLAARDPANDSFSQPSYGLDVSLRQQLPVDGLALFFNGLSLTHPAQRQSRSLVVGPEATEPSEAYTRIAYYPRRFQLGIRYGL